LDRNCGIKIFISAQKEWFCWGI